MADQLATTSDLNAFLQHAVDSTTAALLLECATAVVQEAAGGQRIVQVVGDVLTVMGTTDSWLPLPQLPVTAVTAVSLDGVALTVNTDYQVFGNRLFRTYGWQNRWGLGWYQYGPPSQVDQGYIGPQPSTVIVTYTHGYATGRQELQLARNAVLGLAAGAASNPSGATQERIDDYSATYEAMSARMETSSNLKAALRRQYGRRAGLARIG